MGRVGARVPPRVGFSGVNAHIRQRAGGTVRAASVCYQAPQVYGVELSVSSGLGTGKKRACARRSAFCLSMNRAKRRGVVMGNTVLGVKIIPVIGSARSRVDHEGDWANATRIAQSCQTGTRRFRHANGESGWYYVWISRGMSLSIKASTSSSLSATSSAAMSSS